MPGALRNTAANGAKITAKHRYLANASTLFSSGMSPKKYVRHSAARRTWTVSAGMNQAIERRGTPACKSYRANDARATGMSIDQILRGTSNKTGTKVRNPAKGASLVAGSAKDLVNTHPRGPGIE